MSPEQPDLLPGDFPPVPGAEMPILICACHQSSVFPRKAAGRGRALSWPGDTCAGIQVDAASSSCRCEPWSCTSGSGAGTAPGSTFGCVLVLGTPRTPVIRAVSASCCPHVCARWERGVRSGDVGVGALQSALRSRTSLQD